MPIPQKDIDLITDRADIVEVVRDYVRLERRGGRFWGLSPFKNEKTPSFCVDAEKGLYYCFSTHQGGTVFNFLMNVEHMSFPEAVDMLAKRYGISYQRSAGQSVDAQDHGLKKGLLELYGRVTDSLHYLLLNSDKAAEERRYLQSRGISTDTVKAFRIGYCPAQKDWLWRFLTSKGYTNDLLQKSGFFHDRYATSALFNGRIVFPITNRADKVIAFGARSAHADAQPKYINSPETVIFRKRNEFFGKVRDLIRSDNRVEKSQRQGVYLVEGYMDALALYQLGVSNTVATLGTAFSAEQARLLTRLTNNVTLLFDADTSGRNAVTRVGGILQQMEIEVNVCRLPSGTDPAELLCSSEDFRKNCHQFLAQHTKSMIQYLLEEVFPDKQLINNALLHNSLKQIFSYIVSVPTFLQRDLYLAEVADYLNIDRGSVLRDFQEWSADWQKRRVGRVASDDGTVSRNSVTTKYTSNHFETECMAMSICCMKEFPYFRSIVDRNCFQSKAAKYLYDLQERAFQNEITDSRDVIEMIEHSRLKSYVIRATVKNDTTNCEQSVMAMAHRLKKRYLLRLRKEQIALLRTLEREDSLESKRMRDVELEIMYLNQEILKQ